MASMDALFGKQTPWGKNVESSDALARFFAEGKDRICVAEAVRNEWLLGHRVATVEGKKRVVEFEPMGGGIYVARLFVPTKPPTGAA